MKYSIWKNLNTWIGLFFITGISIPVFAQDLQPVFQANFDETTWEQSGWAFFQSGPEYDPASVSLGLIPSSPTSSDYSNGRGVIVTALTGQGSFIYGPVIPTHGYLALMRLSVLSLAKGGTIAVGALNVEPSGSIGTAKGSVSYAYEADSGQFMGDYQYIHVVYRPQNEAIIPIFQLAVLPTGNQTSVTAMFDRFEVYLLDETTVTDPALRKVLGLDSTSPGATPTPTNPSTSTPTKTPTPTATPPNNPTPSSGSFSVNDLYTLTLDTDQKEAFNPQVAYDQGNQFASVAADLTGGYQDISLREIDINQKTQYGPFTVNQTYENTVAQTPDIAIDSSGIRHIAWSDNRSVEKLFSIYLAQIDWEGKRRVTNDLELNNLYQNTNTAEPALDILDNGKLTVCWRDDRNYLMDVFVRRLNWNGSAVTMTDQYDFQINIPYENTNVSHPDVVMNTNGTIIVTWSDDRVLVDGKKRNDIYARIFTLNTGYTDKRQLPDSAPEVQITGVDQFADQATNPSIAQQNGKYVIVWKNLDPSTSDSFIEAAVINETGTILQTEFIVDSGQPGNRCSAPSITAWQNGQFLITWYDTSTKQLFGQIYDADQNLLIGDPTALIANVLSTEQTSIAINTANRSFLVWDGVTNGFRDIFGASLSIDPGNSVTSVSSAVRVPMGKASMLKIVPQSAKVLSEEDSRRDVLQKSPRNTPVDSPKR